MNAANSGRTQPDANATDDSPAREAIKTQLDTTMLVEAGAGSGKTTLMVDRLLAHIERGTPVEQIAAVTFTKKAANELRERLEQQMELRARGQTGAVGERFEVALRDRERMFIGTVHAFCGRILREYSLEAGLPPDFEELDESAATLLRQASWRTFIEHSTGPDDAILREVLNVGVDPLTVFDAFRRREQYRDVDFPAAIVAAPSHTRVRDTLELLMHRSATLRTGVELAERDALQRTMDRLWRSWRLHDGWTEPTTFAESARVLLSASNRKVVQKNWGDSKEAKAAAKRLCTDVETFVEDELTPWFVQWWAHVYKPVVALLDAGGEFALEQRRRAGQLTFDDLLTETAGLLRSNDAARQSIGERWRFLLVDEFQDTDPVQAEVCFLIASDLSEGNDWRTATPRPGSLFVVGDPKQSIYRFRRADLAMYQLVQSRIAQCGSVQRLTRNFRSVPAVGDLVNEHFVRVFTTDQPATANSPQAAYAPFVAASSRAPHAAAGISRYEIGKAGRESNAQLIAEDAALVASWIAKRCANGDRRPQDFLILTPRKHELAEYAHELAVRNVPVSVTGASGAMDGVLQELLVVINALADPANPIAVIAALEGWCVGCSHADLWEARQSGLEFRITHAPATNESHAGRGLAQLHAWWRASQQFPASTLLERVMNESGLLVLAASSELGDTSAGRLLQLVATLQGSPGTDLRSAVDVIEQSLANDETSATLRPPRADAVRLMNLHKAKGLEAKVVILAAPVPALPRQPNVATWRERGLAIGAMQVADDSGNILAQPLDWETRAADELARVNAEWDRLLYVAVTRAEEELVVSQRASYALASGETRGDTSRWAPLRDVLAQRARALELRIDEPTGRREVELSADDVRTQVEEARLRLAQAKPARYVLISVTEAVKRTAEQAEQDGAPLLQVAGEVADVSDAAAFQFANAHAAQHAFDTVQRPASAASAAARAPVDPRTFGTLVHATLEAALRGRAGDQLREFAAALVWHGVPAATDDVRELLVRAIIDAVNEARGTESWALLTSRGGHALAELNVANFSVRAGTAVLTEGVIDAAVLVDGAWVVVDWKLNRSSDAVWLEQLQTYERQAASYIETLAIRTGAAGTTRIERLRGLP